MSSASRSSFNLLLPGPCDRLYFATNSSIDESLLSHMSVTACQGLARRSSDVDVTQADTGEREREEKKKQFFS